LIIEVDKLIYKKRNPMFFSIQKSLALIITLLSCSVAFSQSWSDVVKAANTEGQLLFYSTKADADNNRILEAFMKTYPQIKARALRLVGGAMVSKVDQEIKVNAIAADVIMHAEHHWAYAKEKEGRLVKPIGPALALWKGAEKYYAGGRVQVTAEPWVIGYNTKLVKTKPTDWDSLLNNLEFKGRVGLNEVTGLTVGIWFEFLDKKKPGYFETMAKLSPKIYPNSAPLTAGLTSGEIAWAPYSLASTIEPLKAKGAPIDYAFPSSGTWAIERSAMILKDVPHPNAALVFLDFLMSQEGQQVLNTDRSGYTVAPGVKIVGGIDVDMSKIANTDYNKYSDKDTKTWQAKVDQLYRR